MSYYAVAKGRKTGLFRTWKDCEIQIKGFSGAVFKKFPTESEAKQFIDEKNGKKRNYVSENANFSVGSDELSDAALMSIDIPELKAVPASSSSSLSFLSAKRKLNTDGDKNPENPAKKLFNIDYKPPKPTTKKKYGSYEFDQDSDGFVHVYTDGSCENNGRKGAVAGLGVFFADYHPLNSSKPVSGRATNNCGEIQASTLAIKLAHDCGIQQLQINTDSQFLIKSICEWLPNWKRKNWKLPSGEPVKNRVDFEELDEMMIKNDMTIKWNYVRAHKGLHGNEMADRLAKEGAALYKISKTKRNY